MGKKGLLAEGEVMRPENETEKEMTMSSTIYKYTLQPGRTVLELHRGAEVLTVQMQRDEPCMWAKVDTTQPMERRTFEVFGTGHTMPNDPRLVYVATFQMYGGSLVFHVFEFPTEECVEGQRDRK